MFIDQDLPTGVVGSTIQLMLFQDVLRDGAERTPDKVALH